MKSAYANLIGLKKEEFITPLVNRFSKNAIEEKDCVYYGEENTIFSIVMALAGYRFLR